MIKFFIILAFAVLDIGSANAADNQYGLYPNLLLSNSYGSSSANSRRYTASARNALRVMERQAKRQAFEDRQMQRRQAYIDKRINAAAVKQQIREKRKADAAARREAERQRWAAMTPAERKAESEAMRKKNEALAAGIGILFGAMSSGGGGVSTSTCPDGSTPSGGMCSRRDYPISAPEPAPAPAPTPYYNGAVGVYSTGQGY